MDSAATVLKAVIDALRGAAPVTALVGARVYSDVPQREVFPYVVVGIQSQPHETQSFSGQLHTVRIQGFSRKAGPVEALSIRAACYNFLNRSESVLDVGTLTLVSCEADDAVSDCFIEDDGKTYQSVCEMAILIQ